MQGNLGPYVWSALQECARRRLARTLWDGLSSLAQGPSGDGAPGSFRVTARGVTLSADGSSVEGELGGRRLRADISAYSQGDEQVGPQTPAQGCMSTLKS